jgi:hypothetical protein
MDFLDNDLKTKFGQEVKELEANMDHLELAKEMTHSTQTKNTKSKDSKMTQTKSNKHKDPVKEKVMQSETKMETQMIDSIEYMLSAIGFEVDKGLMKGLVSKIEWYQKSFARIYDNAKKEGEKPD